MKFVLKPNNRNASDEELIDDLKKVASELNQETLAAREYDESKINRFYSQTISRRIGNGSWNKALKKAGLKTIVEFGMTNIELFENIEQVWLSLGKQPGKRNMIPPDSKYSESPYVKRFGTWQKALEAFVEYMNSDLEQDLEIIEEPESVEIIQKENTFKHKTKRDPSERLKVQVLMRDGNKCRLCGIELPGGENLHFDHIKPWSKGGETTKENLQILCAKHNLAKGNLEYPEK